jgi:ubiquinone/menaquinone biosynthesis C-methylase UbiE
MDKSILPLLCNPYIGEPFHLIGNSLVSVTAKTKFPIIDGIPSILEKSTLAGKTKKSQWFYDRIAFAYDGTLKFGEKTGIANDNQARENYLTNINFPKEGRIFESAIGTGLSIPFFPENLTLFASDISINMLKIAHKKLTYSKIMNHFFQAEGSYLPFRSNLFDVIFQFGALQFHHDTFKCISEMARIALPGATIHIVDEISGIQKILKKMPAHKKYASPKNIAIDSLNRLVPHSMKNVKTGKIANTGFCFLSFEKPN